MEFPGEDEDGAVGFVLVKEVRIRIRIINRQQFGAGWL